MKVAIIPARGGSKRIPRKNIRDFCGKPIISWSIEAAVQSGCFEKVIVSTEDAEIACIARECGADIPFTRPLRLADDHTGTMAVIRHAIDWYVENEQSPDHVCCIYATAPFVLPADIQKGLEALSSSGASYAFSVTNYEYPIARALRVTQEGRVQMLHPEHIETRSQELESAYHDAGQFYWGRSAAWRAKVPIFSPDSTAVILPPYRVHDIDTEDDWVRAELMFEALQRNTEVVANKEPQHE